MTLDLSQKTSSARAHEVAGFVGSFEEAMGAHRPAGPARRAALVLHALRQSDRDWLLQQLPPDHRKRLNPLLAELIDLGIPAAAARLGDERAPRPGAGPLATAGATPSTEKDRLEGADPRALARLLEREPAAMTARLLRLHDWPWRAAVLKRLSPGRRRQIEFQLESQMAGAKSIPAPGLLDTRLLLLLEQRLCERSAGTRAGRRPSRWASPPWRLPSSIAERFPWLKRLGNRARAGLGATSRQAEQ